MEREIKYDVGYSKFAEKSQPYCRNAGDYPGIGALLDVVVLPLLLLLLSVLIASLIYLIRQHKSIIQDFPSPIPFIPL